MYRDAAAGPSVIAVDHSPEDFTFWGNSGYALIDERVEPIDLIGMWPCCVLQIV